MSYVALYRKYRPKDFDDIVGQGPITTTLKNQIITGKVGHAYLFCGMRGTGKTSTARVLAKALNCETGPTAKPCDTCHSCEAINHGSMMDVIEMDAASNRGIDDIRDLREKVNFQPARGKYKVYIIDDVHMLTAEAFNALLKTLEEPPGFVVFVLATTEPNRLPDTILSRCMRFDFTRVATPAIVESLEKISAQEGIKVEGRALSLIAAESQGSMRDALSLLDKALAFGGKSLSYEETLDLLGGISLGSIFDVSRAVMAGDNGKILGLVEDVVAQGKDLHKFLNDLLWHYRNLLMINLKASRDLLDLTDEDYDEVLHIAKGYTKERILSIMDILQEGAAEIKWAQSPRIVAETSLLKLTLPELWDGAQGYISRIQALEGKVQELESEIEDIEVGAERLPQKPLRLEKEDLTESPQPPKEEKPDSPPKPLPGEEGQAPKKEDPKAVEQEEIQKLKKMWGKIVQELSQRGKKGIQSIIQAGEIKPHKIEGITLTLCYNGNEFYKDAVENVKGILENVIEEITGLELRLRDFVDLSKCEEIQREEAPAGGRSNQLIEKVVDYFGEDIVEVEE